MKYKIAYGVIGVVIVTIGLVCYLKREKNKDVDSNISAREVVLKFEKETDNERSSDSVYNFTTLDAELNAHKNVTANTILERHNEADKIMRETVETIMSGVEETVSENEDALNQIIDKLESI